MNFDKNLQNFLKKNFEKKSKKTEKSIDKKQRVMIISLLPATAES